MAKTRKRRRVNLGADFQKRHYIRVADMLCRFKAPEGLKEAFGQMFKQDNPNFDPARFIRAASVC